MSSSAGVRSMYRDPRVMMLAQKFQAYDASQLIGELDMLGLNRRGTNDQLRDRLIRFAAKQFCTQYRIPWDDATDLRPADELPYTLNALNAEISFDPPPRGKAVIGVTQIGMATM